MAGGFVALAVRIVLGVAVYAVTTLVLFPEAREPLRQRLERRFAS